MLSNVPSRRLGAVLAGGASSRFGSDKAVAEHASKPLIEHAITALTPLCDEVVVVGRAWLGRQSVTDRPRPGLGPLGGIAGALASARASDFAVVVTLPCDTPDLPLEIATALAGKGACRCAEAPVIGCWTVDLLDHLDRWLAENEDRSVRRWADAAGVAVVSAGVVVPNVNTLADLAAL